MVTDEIRAAIDAIERNPLFREEARFGSRAEALDELEFHVLNRLEWLLDAPNPAPELQVLQQAAEDLKSRLEAIDETFFERLRSDIRAGDCTGSALLTHIQAAQEEAAAPDAAAIVGYDALDSFTNGLLALAALPVEETRVREPEMVYYQKTPTRIILDLVKQSKITSEDVFYDLGAGLGHVPILVHLLSGATAKGVELEPTYCAHARAIAANLQLARVTFIEADARTAAYSDGTVFFLYTPFEGRMLQEVLARLREEASSRRIRIFTYGPCTPTVAQERWLMLVGGENGVSADVLAEFGSIE